jgi:hypothetical protein
MHRSPKSSSTPAALSISGGLFAGGTGYARGSGGQGLTIGTIHSGTISITGGIFLGGQGGNLGFGGVAATIITDSQAVAASIGGGSFLGGSGGLGSRPSLVFSGSNDSGLGISGGQFSGPMNFNLRTGAKVDVTGGIISGDISINFQDQSLPSVSFFGRDFRYDASSGVLAGMLGDGNSLLTHIVPHTSNGLPIVVTYSSGPESESIRFSTVPEPGSLATFLVGITGSGIAWGLCARPRWLRSRHRSRSHR